MPGVNSLDVIVSVITESEPRSGGSPVAVNLEMVRQSSGWEAHRGRSSQPPRIRSKERRKGCEVKR